MFCNAFTAGLTHVGPLLRKLCYVLILHFLRFSIAAWQHGFGAEIPAPLLAVKVIAVLASRALFVVFLFMIA